MPDDSQVTSPAAPEPSARCPEAALCRRAWDGLWEALLALPDPAFDEPSGCAGWRVRDLAVHLIIGAEDVLITLATPAAPPATADAAGYWELVPPPDGEDPLDALLPRLATAYGDPALLRHHLEDLGAAAHRALAEAPPERLVRTRGTVLAARDLAGAYLLEWTLHHLDLPAPTLPEPEVLAAARGLLEQVIGLSLPEALGHADALRVATGRRAPTSAQRELLGPQLADRLPFPIG